MQTLFALDNGAVINSLAFLSAGPVGSYLHQGISKLFNTMNKTLPLIKDVAGLAKFMKSSSKSFDLALDKLQLVSFGNGKCVAELKVDESHTNSMGRLHGSLSTTLVDTLSSFALMSKVEGPHVSVDIHMSYLKDATVGDEIMVEARVVKSGKKMAFLEVDIVDKASKELLVKGSHTKFIL
jgi:acyl-coenzyme A thioesterase 13